VLFQAALVADPAGAAVSKPSRRPCRPFSRMAGNTRWETVLGPPLAFWLGDIAFAPRAINMFGVYLLAQLCGSRRFWTLYLLARAIVRRTTGVLAVLLTMTVTAFSSPGVEFGPLVLRGRSGAAAFAFLANHGAGPSQRVVRNGRSKPDSCC